MPKSRSNNIMFFLAYLWLNDAFSFYRATKQCKDIYQFIRRNICFSVILCQFNFLSFFLIQSSKISAIHIRYTNIFLLISSFFSFSYKGNLTDFLLTSHSVSLRLVCKFSTTIQHLNYEVFSTSPNFLSLDHVRRNSDYEFRAIQATAPDTVFHQVRQPLVGNLLYEDILQP